MKMDKKTIGMLGTFEPMEFEKGCLYVIIIKFDDGKFAVEQLVTSAPIVNIEQRHQIEEAYYKEYGKKVKLEEYTLLKRK